MGDGKGVMIFVNILGGMAAGWVGVDVFLWLVSVALSQHERKVTIVSPTRFYHLIVAFLGGLAGYYFTMLEKSSFTF